jgi:hypothetical protein
MIPRPMPALIVAVIRAPRATVGVRSGDGDSCGMEGTTRGIVLGPRSGGLDEPGFAHAGAILAIVTSGEDG